MVTSALFVGLLGLMFWFVRRAGDKAAEHKAGGALHSPLYWVGNAIAVAMLALTLYIANQRPANVGVEVWCIAAVLFVGAIGIRIALRRRYFI